MDYKPKDVPDLRNWLVDSWFGPHHYSFDVWWNMRGIKEDPTPPDLRASRAAQRIATAELYWISPDMCDLIVEAARTIPADSCLSADMVPTPNMLVVFGRPIPCPAAEGETWADASPVTTEIAVCHWFTGPFQQSLTQDAEVRYGVLDDAYCSADTVPAGYGCPHVHLVGGGAFPFDMPLNDHETHHSSTRLSSSEFARRLMISTLALLASPGISEPESVMPDRATARRSERAGTTSDIRVIYLRSNRGGGSANPADSTYHHRWVVSGHWRSQPYGPARSLRRPTWIAPHVKGPEGAPLLHGEKVRAVVR